MAHLKKNETSDISCYKKFNFFKKYRTLAVNTLSQYHERHALENLNKKREK